MSKIRKRMLTLIFIDIIVILFSTTCAFLMYDNLSPSNQNINRLIVFQSINVLTIVVGFYFNSLYNRVWRFASTGEVLTIFRTVTLSIVVAYLAFLVIYKQPVPIMVIVNSYLFTLFTIGLSRFSIRLYTDGYRQNKNSDMKNALIIGAGQCGVIIAKELKFNNNSLVHAHAFIDDDPTKLKQKIMGIPVLGNKHDIPRIVNECNISEIIIAIPSASRKKIAEIINICNKTSANIQIIPNISDLIEGRVTLKSMRNVDVEDLLGRDAVVLENEGIESYISGKTILVTGAGGSIGSELCRQIAKFNPQTLLLVGHGENSIYLIHQELNGQVKNLIPLIADVQDRDCIERIFAEYRPQVVFHAAAHKHVPLMEANPSEAIKNNVFGTKNVADCANRYKADKFVLISTDKAVNPTSIMGASKRIAEMYIQSLGNISETKFCAVRFGNVLGSRGSVIPLFKKQIAQGGPVTVTHPEMVRYFMTIPEASRLVIQAGGFARDGEVFVLDMGEPVKIYDLAKHLIRLSGFEPEVDIKIKFSGIRPGEKLYEELLLDEEGMTSTRHERIFIGKPSHISHEELNKQIQNLALVLNKGKDIVKASIVSIVPTFIGETKRASVEEVKQERVLARSASN